ncbi:MAG: beta-lactamase class [Clostridiales bacterium]|jgi:beta-lactamase class A|nr:beta-lactamase class [Clostridiales bacterium]
MDKLSLEARLKAEVVSFSGQFSFYANDFKGNVITVNPNETFEAGSCIKVFILTEFFRQVYEKRIDPNTMLKYVKDNYITGSGILRSLDLGVEMTAKNFATIMIIVSDNIATNTLIDFLGIENINQTCADLGFSSTILHNKINFEKYERLGTTTPRDYGRFFEMLYKEEIWSPEISKQMLGIFKSQHYNRMLTKDLPQYYLDSEDTGDEELIYVASKSGSMDAARNDGGIIHTPYGSYVLAMFTKKFKDPLYYSEHESYLFGGRASRLIFDQYLALKGRFV